MSLAETPDLLTERQTRTDSRTDHPAGADLALTARATAPARPAAAAAAAPAPAPTVDAAPTARTDDERLATVTSLAGRPRFTVVPDRPGSPIGASTRDFSAVRPTPADRAGRRAAIALLERLDGGRLTVVEHGRPRTYGTLTPDRYGRPPVTATITVNHPGAYRAILAGSSRAGESYLDGWWDTDDLTAVIRLLYRNIRRLDPILGGWARATNPLLDPIRRRRRPQDRERDRHNIRAHYDLSNEFFGLFLDPTMMYSSALFQRPGMTLEQAQHAKLDRLCRQLDLRPGHHLIEIGTGWGGMAEHAAAHYGCRVTTTTISEEQYAYATERIARAGLADRVTVLREDYRDLTGTFDRLVSIEMIEAVDWRDYPTYFQACQRLLAPDGAAAIQAIVVESQRFDEAKNNSDFIKDFIFPGGCLPSVGAILDETKRHTDFSLVDLADFGPDYAETLRRWRDDFESNLDRLPDLGLGSEEFARMWQFYLCTCEAVFDERSVSVVQATLARPGWRRAER